MSKELKIDRDKMLSAAKKCPQAKEFCKEMWPEEFGVRKPKFEIFQIVQRKDGSGNYLYLGKEHVARVVWRERYNEPLTTCCDAVLIEMKSGHIFWTDELDLYKAL